MNYEHFILKYIHTDIYWFITLLYIFILTSVNYMIYKTIIKMDIQNLNA